MTFKNPSFIEPRSYPTYEEWKLHSYASFYFLRVRSYPTYEEWKLVDN